MTHPMDRSATEVVITGLGVVSPLGIGRDPFWAALAAGQSGFSHPVVFDVGSMRLPVVGEVHRFDANQFVKPRKAIKLMCRETQLACASAALAMQDAGVDASSLASDRFGTNFGSEMLYGMPAEMELVFRNSTVEGAVDMAAWGRRFPRDMYPLWLLNYLPNMPACHIAIAQQAFGPSNSVVQGDASGLLALIEATTVIQRGWADAMLVGSVGNTISPTKLIYLDHSRYVPEGPHVATACRPFDATSHGMIAAEGSAAFLLESRAHAESRGANVLAHIGGFARGWQAEPGGYRGATRKAIARCLDGCLAAAGWTPQQVGHLNAHATGALEMDRREAQAIHDVLKDVPVTAPKSYFGHAGAGCGSLEAAVSILALEAGLVPPILNYAVPDPECPVQAIVQEPLPLPLRTAILVNHSTTGQVAAVALSRD